MDLSGTFKVAIGKNKKETAVRFISNQRGFTGFEAIFIVIALAAIGGAGYYAYQANHSHPTGSPASKQAQITLKPAPTTQSNTKTYTDKDGYYTVSYPSPWTLREQPFQPSASFADPIGSEADFLPPSRPADIGSVQITKFHSSNPIGQMKDFGAQISNEQALTINGASAYYWQDVSTDYTQDTYDLVKGGTTISISIRERQRAGWVPNQPNGIDNTPYVGDFTAIAKSIKFTR